MNQLIVVKCLHKCKACMFCVTGESYFTIEKSASLIMRMLSISFVFLILLFIPVMFSCPCYPALITSWMYQCNEAHHLDWWDYLKISIIGGLNLLLMLQLLLDAVVHGGYLAFLCGVCLLEYTILIKA